MVKVTVESNGKTKVTSGDAVIGHVIEDNGTTLNAKHIVCGEVYIHNVPDFYVKSIMQVVTSASDDPFEAAEALVRISEKLDSEIKKYMSENADAISNCMKNLIMDFAGGGR